jgi:NADPH:quinone reductase-like Zn-dependent oxidoreductase
VLERADLALEISTELGQGVVDPHRHRRRARPRRSRGARRARRAGQAALHVDQVVPFAEAPRAHALFDGGVTGKIVLAL